MEGGCTCRQVRYRLIGTPLIVHACHCRWCQRETGTAHALNALYEADASRNHGKAPDDIDWSVPERQTRAVAEFLTALDDEDIDADGKLPKVISPVDPCSAWTAKANKRVQFGYGLNYLIDLENAIIVDVEATPARTYAEVAATEMMIKRTAERFGLAPPAAINEASKGACGTTGRMTPLWRW